MQIEELILTFYPTMIFVEHDQAFTEKMATTGLAVIRESDSQIMDFLNTFWYNMQEKRVRVNTLEFISEGK